MADTSDLPTLEHPFALETEEAILELWRLWANEGLDPARHADAWVDTREGGHWWIHTTPQRREAARFYDRLAEVVLVAFPQYAFGDYLDLHG